MKHMVDHRDGRPTELVEGRTADYGLDPGEWEQRKADRLRIVRALVSEYRRSAAASDDRHAQQTIREIADLTRGAYRPLRDSLPEDVSRMAWDICS